MNKKIEISLLSVVLVLSSCSKDENVNLDNIINDKLKGGSNAPNMVKIPAGQFKMGCTQVKGCGKDELPAHKVTIKSFYVSQSEVTFAQWGKCHKAVVCLYNPYNEYKDDSLPVTNVSWDDIQKYITWLSLETGKSYRLLSESEWEYVARAGSQKSFSWGDEVGKNNANCSNCGSKWSDKQPAPTKSFKANEFGLFDLHGNVWEFTQDCFHKNYENALTNEMPWLIDGNCNERMIRGGSYMGDADGMKSTYRAANVTDSRLSNIGFRLARDL